MSRLPKYRCHSRGYGFVQHRSIPTKDHRLYLGKFNTPESKKRYAAFIQQLTSGETLCPIQPGFAPLIKEVVAAYLQHAKQHYARPDGLGAEYGLMKDALRPVLKLFRDLPADQFGPKALVKIRTTLAKSGIARSTANHNLSRIKRMFRWASENEVVAPELYHRLTCVQGLYRGEQNCHEAPPVKPAELLAISAILPHLSPTVSAMLRLQFYCGMRPGEVCIVRACDLDTSGPIWLYRPAKHKTLWRGQSQVKAIPPVAQEIIKQHLRPDRDAYLFSPADSAAWHLQQQAKNRKPRKTKLYPCEVRRVQQKARNSARRVAKQSPGEHYTTMSYRRALEYGFERAEKAGETIPRFSPNQVRHSILTFVSQQLGQQAAQIWAGHSSLDTTNIYTERTVGELVSIAAALNPKLAI